MKVKFRRAPLMGCRPICHLQGLAKSARSAEILLVIIRKTGQYCQAQLQLAISVEIELS